MLRGIFGCLKFLLYRFLPEFHVDQAVLNVIFQVYRIPKQVVLQYYIA